MVRQVRLRPVSKDEVPDFNKHVFPPIFNGGPIDPVPATREIERRLLVNIDVPIDGGGRVRMWILEDPRDSDNGRTFPSPLIRTVEGDVVHARVASLSNTHTVHWHGIEPSPMNDGVGKNSFELTSHFVYQFATNSAGLFFYHCHKNTVLHFEMGLYGAFIVDPRKPDTADAAGVPDPPYPVGGPGFVKAYNPPAHLVKYDIEALWVPDDIDSRWHELNHDAFMQKTNADNPIDPGNFVRDGFLNDFRPDLFSISGQVKRKSDRSEFDRVAIHCRVGQTILLHFLDASYSVEEIHVGLPMTLISQDGYSFGVPPFNQYSRPVELEANRTVRITPAMRGQALIRPTKPGRYPVTIDFFHWITGVKMYTATTFIEVAP
ncbi:MAG: multicopper oxidase domain-containing protein [Chloroflexi bacterium]|nr:multicopper oxidase domain-containing protein [Chloroflexota bacterium]